MSCRHCNAPLTNVFLDLGFAPPSNAYLFAQDLHAPETYFPLKLYVCDECWLVQTEDYADAQELFSHDYAYFSSTSVTWLKHAKQYVSAMLQRLALDENSFVIEVASNDGYLLKNFLEAGIPCLGIEPTASTAAAAEAQQIPVLREFFNENLARDLALQGRQADLILGNNVYAHAPDINNFTMGLKVALKPDGIITLEFPHLLKMIQGVQFDTAYHEHFSYLSLGTACRIFERAGLRIFDVEELPTHGGSIRIFGCHQDDPRPDGSAVSELVRAENEAGMNEHTTYLQFQSQAEMIKNELLSFLIEQRRLGKSVAAYGAAAKGNTLLNFAGIKPDLLPYVFDAATSKQGRYLPGCHIPILPPVALQERRPDYVLILPWNIIDEVLQQNAVVSEWGGKFVVAVPSLRIID